MVLTLQKLIHLHPDGESDSEDDDKDSFIESIRDGPETLGKAIRKLFSKSKGRDKYKDNSQTGPRIHAPVNGFVTAHTEGVPGAPIQKLRTLQRYRGGPNHERMEYMERHSPLTSRNLAVSAEQVSIFLTSGMTSTLY
jgi:hypothetical protein